MTPVLALVGPTGSGKSAIALDVAERLGAEIVAVDAFTVYRGMDIGTAKPTSADRARVPHHMLDRLDPGQECTVRWFQQEARTAVDGVVQRGRTAVLVGGSGLYFRAVVDPLEFPPTDEQVRARLEERFEDEPRAAHAALAAVDPEAAGRIDPDNLRRSVRALEVLELTGRLFSSYRLAWDAFDSVYPGLGVVGLELARDELRVRIAARVDAMLAAGLVAEVERVAALPLSTTARQAIGYAEVFAHLAGECTLDEARERIIVRTGQFAARQLRWFRGDPRVRWQPPEKAGAALLSAARPTGATG